MTESYDPDWWEKNWTARMTAIQESFGALTPPGQVHSFTSNNIETIVPGACGCRVNAGDDRSLFISVGLTQPLTPRGTKSHWEFGVYAAVKVGWPYQLLFDLVEIWAEDKDFLSEGHFLPLTFFHDSRRNLSCDVVESSVLIPRIGQIEGLYLWPDFGLRRIVKAPTGSFSILIATGVTKDEEELADETSPPHLMLLLKRLGIGQLTDPFRSSARLLPTFRGIWEQILLLDHDEVVETLGAE